MILSARPNKTNPSARQSLALLLIVLPFIPLGALSRSDKPDEPIPSVVDSVTVPAGAPLPLQGDIARIKGFPSLGKWMYQDDMKKAHWLGLPFEGKTLLEPVNIILVDTISHTEAQSIKELFKAMDQTGYAEKPHHSSGYMAYIGDAFWPQFPRTKYTSFSNQAADVENNHGRVFGPYRFNGKLYYTAAFSREIIVRDSKIWHHYGSFDRARDEFSREMSRKSSYKITGFACMDNTYVGARDTTTGDHDGVAVVLTLSK